MPASKEAAAPAKTTDPAVKTALATSTNNSDTLLKGIVDPNVVQASCPSCGGGGLLRGDTAGCGPAGCPSIGCNGCNCVPGRTHCCSICDSDTIVGRAFCGLYECLCCPDRCYEPEYIPAANAAFFVDSARPVTQTRLRYDGMFDINNVDRAEYLMAHSSLDKGGIKTGCGTSSAGKGLNFIPLTMDINQISLYQEAAVGKFSAFVSMPYEHLEPNGVELGTACPHSGFGDLIIGTKSLLIDCDLLQFAFQFSTFLPTGNFGSGLGTGHVSLEPAILFTLKLTPDAYFQGELAYWIPIAGDPLFAGPIWHNHFSFNQVLCRILPDVQVIGTLEFVNYNVQGGNYTAAAGTTVVGVSATDSMFSAGPGVRLDVCKHLDVGVGSQFNFTGPRYADEQVRFELRWRF
jgi:hypothetical protein